MCCALLHQNRVCVNDTIVGHHTCCQGPMMSQIHICNIPVHPQSLTPLEEAFIYIYIYIYKYIYIYMYASQVLTSQWHMLQLWNQQQMRIEVSWNPEWHHCGSPETCNSKWLQNLLYLHLVDEFCTNYSSVYLSLTTETFWSHLCVCLCMHLKCIIITATIHTQHCALNSDS